jgi:hypothetical protein
LRIIAKLDCSEDQSQSLDPSKSFGSQEIGLSQSHGICLDCGKQRSAAAWCENCDIAILKINFRNWTSGNPNIDEFIRNTQLKAKENMDYLEWIEFDQFELVKNINKRGAFSSIYSAVWMEGPRWNLDEEADVWNRNGPVKVILKRLDNSQNMSQEFIEQVSFICYKHINILINLVILKFLFIIIFEKFVL